MALPIEEVDKEGRAIFFQSPADISDPVKFDSYDLSTQDRVNDLYNENRLPDPRFHGFVYNYSSCLSLHYRSESSRRKIKQKIDYKAIQATYPCERDPTLVFMVVANSKVRNQLRVLRLPTPLVGTKFRYVIDQLQLSPIRESANFKNGSVRTTMNSGSSFSTPMAEESDASVTSASHYFYRSAAHNPTMRAFYGKEEEEPKLPRVQPFAFSSMAYSNVYNSQRSLNRQKSDIFDNFDPTNYEIYRPVSRKSRDDRYAYDYGDFRRSSRRRASRPRFESSGYNYNSRAAVRNKSLVYLDPEYGDYRGNRYEYDVPQRSTFDRTSRSGSVPRRYAHY
ncbi:unnamed protein product [Hydatigera taeniaeformis]|uniref:Expressed conserved protein n=1 Tax=Hydatigena taeniaeformis TaxID=6205 RepID=A0A0R3X051_HYDTA|nr:unnamed protein product [Hydatigera taeniaeformis]